MSRTPQHPRYEPAQPWYARPQYAIWLGPALIVGCLALRFAWGGLAGPPAPFWVVAYLLGIGGGLLTCVGVFGRTGR